jgi:DNA-binding response OmpR family regulator
MKPGAPVITTTPPRPLVLIVDDSSPTRSVLRESARLRGYDVIEADDAAGAVQGMRNHRPDLVLLAAELRGTNGLATLHEMRDEDPSVVVVLLVTESERETVLKGLDLGAVNFLKKPVDPQEAAFLFNELFLAIEDEADIRQVLHLVARRRTRLTFPGTPAQLSRIVAFLGREVRNGYPGLRVPVTEIKLALYEALANAIEHGNLEIDFDAKTQALNRDEGFEPLLRERMANPRLARRRIHVEVDYLPDRVVYKVRDEGGGFRPEGYRNPAQLLNTSALHGRGLALIHHYMDKVAWNPRGNEIRMTKRIVERRRSRSRAQEPAATAGGQAPPEADGTPRSPGS